MVLADIRDEERQHERRINHIRAAHLRAEEDAKALKEAEEEATAARLRAEEDAKALKEAEEEATAARLEADENARALQEAQDIVACVEANRAEATEAATKLEVQVVEERQRRTQLEKETDTLTAHLAHTARSLDAARRQAQNPAVLARVAHLEELQKMQEAEKDQLKQEKNAADQRIDRIDEAHWRIDEHNPCLQ